MERVTHPMSAQIWEEQLLELVPVASVSVASSLSPVEAAPVSMELISKILDIHLHMTGFTFNIDCHRIKL